MTFQMAVFYRKPLLQLVSRRDSPILARRFNAGLFSDCPCGTKPARGNLLQHVRRREGAHRAGGIFAHFADVVSAIGWTGRNAACAVQLDVGREIVREIDLGTNGQSRMAVS
jgi:hypothetical protein